ncbi:MAG: hypothetical protein HFH92_12595 [Lachnospiraceae bacterium]|uniref:hypothetical protein n=1 Tax=uncultured Acetatifactor sp. TaxID=1671927 RepID=UPI00261813B5|nr:hypothetical protein [uncultured Acetatifactor sp.]MCI8789928.1 hypothetical protein [Lachnospiraceae bacterium]
MKDTKNDTQKNLREDTQKKKMTSRQLVAIIGVALLALLYLITLVTAIVDSSESAKWFRICLFGTFAVPLVIWIYSWMYARLTGKRGIGDPEAPGAAAADVPGEPKAK